MNNPKLLLLTILFGIGAIAMIFRTRISEELVTESAPVAELNFDANFTDVLVYDNEVDINQDEVEIPSFSLLDY